MDVAYTYLTYFEDDDAKLEEVYKTYKEGTLLTGELKKMAIDLLQDYVQQFQERRKLVTDEVLEQYMKPRKLEWEGNKNPIAPPPKEDKEGKESKGKKGAKGDKESKESK